MVRKSVIVRGTNCDDIGLNVNPLSRCRLATIITDRNSPPRQVLWRAEIVLATANGHGTNETMRRTGKSKPRRAQSQTAGSRRADCRVA